MHQRLVQWLVPFFLLGCSQVSLTYGVSLPRLTGSSLEGQNQVPQSLSDNPLAGLKLLARVRTQQPLDGLTLRLQLRTPSGELRQLNMPLTRFLNNPSELWRDLVPGNNQLELQLFDAQNRELGRMQTLLKLVGQQIQQVDFSLLDTLTGALMLQWEASENTNALEIPAQPQPSALPEVPTTPDESQPVQLTLRLIQTGVTTASFVWQGLENETVVRYRLVLDGRDIGSQENTTLSLRDLREDTAYRLTVIPVRADGTELTAAQMPFRTAQQSGGGGGGGASVNLPPEIVSLTPSRTTVSGLGYPVTLAALATDDRPLGNAAYTWSCDDCPSGSHFDRTDSPNAIFTVPVTGAASSYTVRLTVSDGVNLPVTATQVIQVTHFLSDVIVEGDYQ